MPEEFLEYAVQYHARLPLRLREYLHERGVADFIIDRYLVGWSGWRLTIPIYDRDGRVCFFRLAKDPADPSDGPEMMSAPGGLTELYGWEHLRSAAEQVIVCESEFNRLLLESRGYAAVTPTGGPGTFRREWANALKAIPRVFVCLANSASDRVAARRIGRLVPHARIVRLPEQVGQDGSVAEFFLNLNRTCTDFDDLLEASTRVSSDGRRRTNTSRTNG